MEPEQLEHGRKFTLRDFLTALREKGRSEQADQFNDKFSSLYCPPLTHDQLLDQSFNELCEATELINTTPLFSIKNPSVFPKLLKSGQTREGSDFRFGRWYLKKVGKWPLKSEP